MTTRQLICCILGHIDHGKTTLLDKIRGTTVNANEPGGMTQHVGASEVPLSVIKNVCGPLLKGIKGEISLPGLLFIDTPGHAAFNSLRERGGSIADIAVLVVDAQDVLQPQAIESIQILKQFKVPFVIAFNKIDSITGWMSQQGKYLLENIKLQSQDIQMILEQRLYMLVNELSNLGFESDRFDRVSDFTKQVSIVPTSGKTGEGIPELLMVLTGLSQRYLEKSLQTDLDLPAEGNVLEVKEVKGLGKTLDVIVYDGTLKEGDIIVIGGLDGPIKSKARVLLKPAPLQEMREKGEFSNVKEVKAASGVKVSGPGLEKVIPGVPLIACASESEVKSAEEKVQESIKRVVFKTEKEGLTLRADSLGALEALTKLFNEFPIKKAVIGNVMKSDVIEAGSVKESKPELGVILAFNVGIQSDAQELITENKIKVFSGVIIYDLFEKYKKYREEVDIEVKRKALSGIILPVKINVLPDHVFRASGPAIVGVEILAGTLRVGYPLINESLKDVGLVKSIRHDKEVLGEASKGMQVAVGIEGGIYGRNFNERDNLYSNVNETDFLKMKTELKKFLTESEIEAMRELLTLRRKQNSMWGF